jgi:hypothetical protein
MRKKEPMMILSSNQHYRIAKHLREIAKTCEPEKRERCLKDAALHLALARVQLERPELRPMRPVKVLSR